ncbi:MAG: hypothetical protein WCK47_01005 [bacterium]|nr:hypothetical protein [Candidatus Sumerlaeota bacterium]
MKTQFIIAIVAGVVLFWAVMIGLIVFVLTRLAGGRGGNWKGLAKRYTSSEAPPDGNMFKKQTIRMGSVNYKNCVTIGVSQSGLYLALSGFFGKAARLSSVLIPWEDIKVSGATRLYWRSAVMLNIANPPLAQVTLYQNIFNAIQQHLKPA